MRTPLKLAGSMAAAALVLTSATPAAARDWGRYERHHHRDNDAGAVIGAIAAVGIIAALASAASAKKKREAQVRYETQPPYAPGTYPEPGYVDRDYDAPRYDSGRSFVSQDEAVDACALAARDEGTRNAGFAEVRDITGVSPLGTGWDVSGRIEQRSSYRSTRGDVRGFRCAFQDGRVSAVSID